MFSLSLCWTPLRGEGGRIVLVRELRTQCPIHCPLVHRGDTTESKSDQGCRKESGFLLVRGKGDGIPLGNSDQIPASDGEGQLDPLGAVATDPIVSSVMIHSHVTLHSKAWVTGGWGCYRAGLGGTRLGVPQKHSHSLSAAPAWPDPICASLLPSEQTPFIQKKPFYYFFFPKKKSNINIRV